jgi:hypothetical protein
MDLRDGRLRFTLRDMLVPLVIVALGMALLVPYIQEAREAARRAQCIQNMKGLGLALCNFCDEHRRFPASSDVTRNPDGTIAAIDGWSFLVHLLPYIDISRQSLYETLDVDGGKPLVEPKGSGTPHLDAANTRLADLVCPSNPNSTFAGTGYVTNYKAMGATHIESLMVASPKPTVPLYDPGTPAVHPDGSLFPGTGLRLSAFGRDGAGHTIFCAETMDPKYGVWTIGAECTLVGLPSRRLDETGEWARIEFEKHEGLYYAPAGFKGEYNDQAAPEVRRLKTYLGYDFAKADPGAYVGADKRNTYGPSSAHPGVVNHLFGDGSVRSLSTGTDFAFYMFMITRNGGDPTWMGFHL